MHSIFHRFSLPPQCPELLTRKTFSTAPLPAFLPSAPRSISNLVRYRSKCALIASNASQDERGRTHLQEEEEEEDEEYDDDDGDEDREANPSKAGGRWKKDGKDYDRDPEMAEILGNCIDEPLKAQKRLEERIRKKRSKILHTKTGSAVPMMVIFNKFDFTNSYIWFEFYHAPLTSDITLICDTIRSWHIIGRLGGCNSMNMQLSQSPLDRRPTYDAIQGANVTPTTFYNIGDLEVQDNLARLWVDIGTSEPLLLDVLINALNNISSDYVGIKQLVFGGSDFENWKESLMSEEAGYSVHKI